MVLARLIAQDNKLQDYFFSTALSEGDLGQIRPPAIAHAPVTNPLVDTTDLSRWQLHVGWQPRTEEVFPPAVNSLSTAIQAHQSEPLHFLPSPGTPHFSTPSAQDLTYTLAQAYSGCSDMHNTANLSSDLLGGCVDFSGAKSAVSINLMPPSLPRRYSSESVSTTSSSDLLFEALDEPAQPTLQEQSFGVLPHTPIAAPAQSQSPVHKAATPPAYCPSNSVANVQGAVAVQAKRKRGSPAQQDRGSDTAERPSKKRRRATAKKADGSEDKTSESSKPFVVERQYRDRLNAQFELLLEALPSGDILNAPFPRTHEEAAAQVKKEAEEDETEASQPRSPAKNRVGRGDSRVSKAEVLEKARCYLELLETRHQEMMAAVEILRAHAHTQDCNAPRLSIETVSAL
jgi:hypothetical protein